MRRDDIAVADMEVDMVADMEADNIADMVANKFHNFDQVCKASNVLKRSVSGRSCLMRSVPDLRVLSFASILSFQTKISPFPLHGVRVGGEEEFNFNGRCINFISENSSDESLDSA